MSSTKAAKVTRVLVPADGTQPIRVLAKTDMDSLDKLQALVGGDFGMPFGDGGYNLYANDDHRSGPLRPNPRVIEFIKMRDEKNTDWHWGCQIYIAGDVILTGLSVNKWYQGVTS